MNAAAGADLSKSDTNLNIIYQEILSQNSKDKQFCTDLKEAQRAWLKFVDLHLKTVFPLKEGQDPRVVYGSIYPLDYAVTKTSLIQQRVEQLKSLSSNSTE